jgi:cyclophilin family peptidyl-prolyl cis-trans isomerase
VFFVCFVVKNSIPPRPVFVALLRVFRSLSCLLLAVLPAVLRGEESPPQPPLADGLYAEVTTPAGTVVAELHYRQAPLTVANYVGLAEGTLGPREGVPFYDGLTFHRVVDDFVVQGGDPTGTGEGGPGYEFPDEIVPGLRHDRAGVVQMANAGPDTNGSQWCFMLRATPRLNYLHSVFGHVVRGLEVLPRIRQGDPMQVKILRVGAEAESFRVSKTSFAAQVAAAKKYAGPSQPGPDAPFDDPDKLLPTDWERARSFTFKLANFERFTRVRLCARLLALTPEGGIDRYLQETAARLGTAPTGALVIYCADTGRWHYRLGEQVRDRLGESVDAFFAAARRGAEAAQAYAQARLPAGETLTAGQKLKLEVDAVLDALIFRLEPGPPPRAGSEGATIERPSKVQGLRSKVASGPRRGPN